jgi:hypothetical protein
VQPATDVEPRPGLWRQIGYALTAAWIFGGGVFFLFRFSAIFYGANKSAIDALLEKLGR